jgi:hypothetical protein
MLAPMAAIFAAAIPLPRHEEIAQDAAAEHPQPTEQEQGIRVRPAA